MKQKIRSDKPVGLTSLWGSVQVYPNGTVGNKSHVSIFLENKSNEPLHISEVVFTFQAFGAAPLTWNAPKKELESEDDWGFQR